MIPVAIFLVMTKEECGLRRSAWPEERTCLLSKAAIDAGVSNQEWENQAHNKLEMELNLAKDNFV